MPTELTESTEFQKIRIEGATFKEFSSVFSVKPKGAFPNWSRRSRRRWSSSCTAMGNRWPILALGYDPAEPASEEEWPEECR
jgi:hypothetical protein